VFEDPRAAFPVSGQAAQRGEGPAAHQAGRCAPVSRTRRRVGPRRSAITPRRALLLSTFARCIPPAGSRARQSVNVPPVSIQTRQRSGGAISDGGVVTGRRFHVVRQVPCPGYNGSGETSSFPPGGCSGRSSSWRRRCFR
jgi:hypothetical protein